jgi:hypothetical protein
MEGRTTMRRGRWRWRLLGHRYAFLNSPFMFLLLTFLSIWSGGQDVHRRQRSHCPIHRDPVRYLHTRRHHYGRSCFPEAQPVGDGLDCSTATGSCLFISRRQEDPGQGAQLQVHWRDCRRYQWWHQWRSCTQDSSCWFLDGYCGDRGH